MRRPTLLTLQLTALRRSALMLGKVPFNCYRFIASTNSTAEKACQTRGARGAPPIIINTSEAKPRFCERYL